MDWCSTSEQLNRLYIYSNCFHSMVAYLKYDEVFGPLNTIYC